MVLQSVAVAGTTNINGISSWAVGDEIISNGSVWQKIVNVSAVNSVNGYTGVVVLGKADVGLGNVDNTSDAAKPVSTATVVQLDLKEDKANKGVAFGYAGLDATGKVPAGQAPPDLVTSVAGRQGVVVLTKTDVGLANVDNTSDATKNSAVGTLTNKTINGANNTLTVRLDADVTNNLPTSRLNSGTGANSGSFWRGDGQWAPPAGGGDVVGPASAVDGDIAVFNGTNGKVLKTTGKQVTLLVDGQASSVDGEAVLFSGTTGKLIKRSTDTGLAKLTAGVQSAVAAPSGAVVGTTDTQTLTNKTLVSPIVSNTGYLYRPSGVLYANTTSIGNTGATENTVWTITIPAGMLAKDGDSLRITAWIYTAAAAGSKTFRVRLGSVLIYENDNPSTTSYTYNYSIVISRTATVTAPLMTVFYMASSGGGATSNTSATVDVGAAQDLSLRSYAPTTNYIYHKYSMVEFLPVP